MLDDMPTTGMMPGVQLPVLAMQRVQHPSQEGLAVQRNVRSGIQSLPEAIRERGYDPDELLAEIADFNKKLDALGIVLDTDPRKMSQAGQQQSVSLTAPGEPQ